MLLGLVNLLFSLYELGLLVYVLCAWVVHPAAGMLRLRLAVLYEPALVPIRRWLVSPRVGDTYIDLSPLFLYIALGLLHRLVVAILW